MKKPLLLLAVIATSCSPKVYHQQQTSTYLKAPTLRVNFQEALVQQLEKNNIQEDTLQFNFTYWSSWKDSKFYTEKDTIFITNNGLEQEFFHWVWEQDTVVLDIYKQFNPGRYDKKYKTKNTGKVNVVIPEVYELANVLFTLTAKAQPSWVNQETEYYQRVQEYFAPFKSHPIFQQLSKDLNSSLYLNIRENSAAYVFEGHKIVPSPTYAGFRARDQFRKLLPLIQDFALTSNFLSFYRQEAPFYEQLKRLEQDRAQVKDAWEWLQNQFPAKVDYYRLIMSPLAGGSHSIRLFENNHFKENIIFMSAPALISKDSVGPGIPDALALRRAFTEIDHNYVNPISDRYLPAIQEAMAEVKNWNTKGSYGSPYETFNEYMTWAVFGLYVYDRFGETVYSQVMPTPVDFMENSRGFVRFGTFNQQLLKLFRKYEGRKKVPELYPEMLEWVKQENSRGNNG